MTAARDAAGGAVPPFGAGTAASSAAGTDPTAAGEAPLPGLGVGAIEGVALLLWAADADAPHRLATPFFHAAAAAAFDVLVEVYFTAASVRLLAPGVAEQLRADPSHPKTVLDAMREAAGHGAVFLACGDALAAHGLAATKLIAECTRRGGAVQFMARVLDPRWRTLVF